MSTIVERLTVTNALVKTNGQNQATLAFTNGSRFYRLQKSII